MKNEDEKFKHTDEDEKFERAFEKAAIKRHGNIFEDNDIGDWQTMKWYQKLWNMFLYEALGLIVIFIFLIGFIILLWKLIF